MANNTWTLESLLTGRKPISFKLVFKIKQGANGEVKGYKTKLVAKGFTKTYKVDSNILRPSQSLHLFVVFLH
jgi:hypothetical protein